MRAIEPAVRAMTADELFTALLEAREVSRYAQDEFELEEEEARRRAAAKLKQSGVKPGPGALYALLEEDPAYVVVREELIAAKDDVAELERAYDERLGALRVYLTPLGMRQANRAIPF